jgi:hypothetical protein
MQQQQQQIQSMQASSVPTTANSLFANNSLLSNGSTGSAPTNAKMALSETPATAPAATGVYNSKPESEKAQVSYSTGI